MMNKRPLRVLLALAVSAAAITAQDGLPPDEARAFELKAEGRYREAQTAFVELLLRQRGDAIAAARAEFYATLAHLLASRTGDLDVRETLLRLTEGELARAHPTLRDRLLSGAMELDQLKGDLAGALVRTEQLGYLSRWHVIGPFDNERGAGFARAFGPERGLDLDAVYDGKKRPVRWRPSPVGNPPAGVVDLDAMVRPDDQVLCYAAVALRSEREQDVILHLGSDEAFKVFLNGAEVVGRDISRTFAHDQDAFLLRLGAGQNLLMLKICDQEGGFAFAARLRGADGRPVTGVHESDSRDDLTAAAAATAIEQPGKTPFLGARTVFQHDDDPGDPVDAFRLGLLLALNHPDDPTDRRDQRLAEAAARAMPGSAAARYLVAFTRLRPGKAEEKEENARRQDYLDLLAQHRDHVEAMRSLAEMDLSDVGANEHVERLVRKALRVNPEFAAGHLLLGQILSGLELGDLAEVETERAARPDAAGHRFPEAAIRLFRQASNLDDRQTEDRLGKELLTTAYGASVVDEVARSLMRRGDRDEARALLERAEEVLPFARGPRQRLCRSFEAGGDIPAALATLQRWLTICPEDDEVLLDMARLHGLLQQRDRQIELLRTALELNPNRKDEQRYLEFLEAGEQPFYQDYAMDGPAVIAKDEGPPADAAAANDPFYYLLRDRVLQAYRNGTTSDYRHEIVHILTERGARDFSSYAVRHFWGEQRARLLSVRVYKKDGQELRPRLSGSYVKLPPLQPGDVVEISSRTDDLAAGFFGDYFGLVHRFSAQDGAPTSRSRLCLILDGGRDYRFQAANGAPDGQVTNDPDGREIRTYEMASLPRYQAEERRPDWGETDPLIRVTTYDTWTEFSSWWWNLIRKQTEITADMRAKVEELTAGRPSEIEKIAAIYRFVTTDIRYKAWEFGVHGYKPYSTPVIFERRHGDCKDKALLLNALLGEVGVEAYPVLIHADPQRSNDDLSLPMVEHFNHCISYLPPKDDRPGLFLDGTATYHPTDTLPEMDRGAKVLVVKGGAGELLDIPWPDPTRNADREDYVIDLAESGRADIAMAYRPLENQATWVREFLGNEPGKRKENVERYLAQHFGNVQVEQVDASDLLDIEQPVELDVAFGCPEFAPRQDGGLALKPVLAGRPMQHLTSASSRKYPLLIGLPETEEQVFRYRLPDGYAPLNLPEPVDIRTRFGSYRLVWSFADGEVRLERRRTIATPRVEPEEYGEFREFAIQVDQSDQRVVIVKQEKSR